jgi:hypothetical protein
MADRGIDKCGPGFISKYIYQGKEENWVPICQAHDRAYTYRDIKRSDADKDLLFGLLLHSKTSKQIALAWIYYYTVRAFGWLLYYSPINRGNKRP